MIAFGVGWENSVDYDRCWRKIWEGGLGTIDWRKGRIPGCGFDCLGTGDFGAGPAWCGFGSSR